MATGSADYHEPLNEISRETRLKHQAIVSLQEEFEAVDWYRQRADACTDEGLKRILLHNMREELEHASMVLEWLRRNDEDVDRYLREYLFTEGEIVELEEESMGRKGGGGSDSSS